MFDKLNELMRDDTPEVGVVIISGKSCSLYSIAGTSIKRLSGFDVDLPNKQRKGGQSQKRFERLGKEARFNYISKVVELVERTYQDQILFIGGPAEMKDKLAERLKIKVSKVFDTQYDKIEGLRELIHRYPDLLTNELVKKEKVIIDKFFSQLLINSNLVAYGDEYHELLADGLISDLIVHEDLIDDSIREKCQRTGTELHLISSFYSEANQIKSFGVVGLLRYEIQRYD